MRSLPPETQKSRIGIALRAVRKARGLTQEDFVRTNRTTIGRIENDERGVTLDKLEELAEELQVHPYVLLTLAYTTKLTKAEAAEFVEAAWDQLDALFHSSEDTEPVLQLQEP